MTNIIALRDRWFTIEELAERQGISTRTVYRRLKAGTVEARETEEGTRYRLTPTDRATDSDRVTDSHDTPTDSPTDTLEALTGSPDRRTDTTDRTLVTDTTDTALVTLCHRLEALATDKGRLQAERDQLAAELAEWKRFALEAVEEVERLRGY
jgi:excisionase family DNA binding protein